MGGRSLAAGALLLTAACCCLAVLGGGWSHAGVASDTDVTAGGGMDRHVALVVRTQRIHDPTAKAKQLETQAHKQAALARLEAKTVKSLTAELSHLTAPTAIVSSSPRASLANHSNTQSEHVYARAFRPLCVLTPFLICHCVLFSSGWYGAVAHKLSTANGPCACARSPCARARTRCLQPPAARAHVACPSAPQLARDRAQARGAIHACRGLWT